ncbi:hypothetical protein TL16_g00052 [Triparma laevis f. inornata]|uniref:Uncharacterized protein n=2 Tax=Triparma laevis TaxID=1534972 RepID=A0A9W7FAK7_9STRA|nr:hypothetical protein TL16_g00052 [Triparma laevis f. inornata]GMI07778.1 hypothetical protein TrLO_g11555 [Triparma laevis f. longispina]
MARYAHMFVVMVVLLLISASSLVEAAAGAGGEKTCPKAGVDMLKSLGEKLKTNPALLPKEILIMAEFRKYSYEQIKIAVDFVKNKDNNNNFSSCPNAMDSKTGECKNLQEVPPFSACKMYSASSHAMVIADNIVAKKDAIFVAVNILKNVPLSEIEKNWPA